MKAFGSEIHYSSVICTYGYSYVSLIPTIIICSIPYSWLQVIILTISLGISGSIILVTLWNEFSQYASKKKYFCLGLVIICQIVLFLFLKFYFLNYIFRVQDSISPVKANNEVPSNTQPEPVESDIVEAAISSSIDAVVNSISSS